MFQHYRLLDEGFWSLIRPDRVRLLPLRVKGTNGLTLTTTQKPMGQPFVSYQLILLPLINQLRSTKWCSSNTTLNTLFLFHRCLSFNNYICSSCNTRGVNFTGKMGVQLLKLTSHDRVFWIEEFCSLFYTMIKLI